ncbi:DNA mismatch repair protein Mlh1 isoform X2 [Glossina fuscipes]|uniref:DNA mismatch repair protein Mlh1 isoform X2 n=1 Tax=Glossina fuscipes TaxID=7396 RepID=A0A9C5ZGV6_9MUSC|nr:DNA mismatch repair protein Mlh1 isoform X2 [Glossina fuscipes]
MDPGIIKKLDQAVVNRIAAGEVIQRPANALKELIENSLDAKASLIQVTVKVGGLKLLQIEDNGTGIRKEDLEIVCERFTTSKLTTFEDLTKISTFGFRGEALASISHVAHLTIQTKTRQERCAYKASYEDGQLQAKPKACAGNQGTIIVIEDLFYNMPQRRQAFKTPNEEFQKIYDVTAKYAIHNSRVGFMLKKHGEQLSLKTNVNSTQEANIQIIYGNDISKELMSVDYKDQMLQFSLSGLITKVNYNNKKGIMLLFINNRLVESTALKTAIDNVYSTYLPKDVNVHPTKHEVHFLYEDEIVEKIKSQIETQLLGSNATRTFYKQLKLPGIGREEKETGNETSINKSAAAQDKVSAKDMIRTDSKEQKLDKFLFSESNKKTDDSLSTYSNGVLPITEQSFRVTAKQKTKEVKLTSVLKMMQQIENKCSVQLRKILKEMVFVGSIDKSFALFQYETKLYLSNTLMLSKELFYQRLVYNFENFCALEIAPERLSIKSLILLALNSTESGWCEEDGDKEELAQRAVEILLIHSPIMREYFSLNISPEGDLLTLPLLLEQYCPSKAYLPLYMLRLATDVEWEEEEKCFETFCRETAHYYATVSEADIKDDPKRHRWQTEHVLYPALKKYLLPSEKIRKELYELTSLPKLYKVFERC